MAAWSPREALAADEISQRPSRGDVLIIGSSSISQVFGRIIGGELSSRGYDVIRKGVPSAGLARPDYRDMNRIVEDLPISDRTAAVFVYLGINDAQAMWLHPRERDSYGERWLPWNHDRWDALYTRRARAFLERICQRGAKRAFVLLPVEVKGARLERRLRRIRKLQARAAAAASCALALETTGDAAHFDRGGEPRRKRDGFHMSQLGARLVWNRVRSVALRELDAHGRGRKHPGS